MWVLQMVEWHDILSTGLERKFRYSLGSTEMLLVFNHNLQNVEGKSVYI
jgi:hypothetical protein